MNSIDTLTSEVINESISIDSHLHYMEGLLKRYEWNKDRAKQIVDALNQIREKMHNHNLYLGTAGEASEVKGTFINAILKDELFNVIELLTGIIELIYIKYSKDLDVEVQFNNHTKISYIQNKETIRERYKDINLRFDGSKEDINNFIRFIVSNELLAINISEVIIYHPSQALKSGLVLVVINDSMPISRRSERKKNIRNACDAVVVVNSSNEVSSELFTTYAKKISPRRLLLLDKKAILDFESLMKVIRRKTSTGRALIQVEQIMAILEVLSDQLKCDTERFRNIYSFNHDALSKNRTNFMSELNKKEMYISIILKKQNEILIKLESSMDEGKTIVWNLLCEDIEKCQNKKELRRIIRENASFYIYRIQRIFNIELHGQIESLSDIGLQQFEAFEYKIKKLFTSLITICERIEGIPDVNFMNVSENMAEQLARDKKKFIPIYNKNINGALLQDTDSAGKGTQSEKLIMSDVGKSVWKELRRKFRFLSRTPLDELKRMCFYELEYALNKSFNEGIESWVRIVKFSTDEVTTALQNNIDKHSLMYIELMGEANKISEKRLYELKLREDMVKADLEEINKKQAVLAALAEKFKVID